MRLIKSSDNISLINPLTDSDVGKTEFCGWLWWTNLDRKYCKKNNLDAPRILYYL